MSAFFGAIAAAIVGILTILALNTGWLSNKLGIKAAITWVGLALFILASGAQIYSLWPEDPKAVCRRYGLTIDAPEGGYVSTDGTVKLTGTFVERPPDELTRLLVVTTANDHWPMAQSLSFDNMSKTWSGTATGVENYSVSIAIMGENGKILTDYFLEASDDTPVALTRLPDDIEKCDTTTVTVQRP